MLKNMRQSYVRDTYAGRFTLPDGWDEGLLFVNGIAADGVSGGVDVIRREDALDVTRMSDDTLKVAIHVPAVGALATVGGLRSTLEKDIDRRPRWQIDHCIQAIGGTLLTFTGEHAIPVVTASALLGMDGSVEPLEPALGQCQARVMTREEFDVVLRDETEGSLFVQATRLLLRHRGASPRLQERAARGLTGADVVHEFAILANGLLTDYCKRNGLPLGPENADLMCQFTAPLRDLISYCHVANVEAWLRNSPVPYSQAELDYIKSAMREAWAEFKRKTIPLPKNLSSEEIELVSSDTLSPNVIVQRSLSAGKPDERLVEMLEIGALTAVHAARLVFSRAPGLREVREGLAEVVAGDASIAASIFEEARTVGLIKIAEEVEGQVGEQHTATLDVMRSDDERRLPGAAVASSKKQALQLAKAAVVADACGSNILDEPTNRRGWLIDARGMLHRIVLRIPDVELAYSDSHHKGADRRTVYVSEAVVTNNRGKEPKVVTYRASSPIKVLAKARAAHLAHRRLTAQR